jgi:hypothetical protein
MNVIGPSQRDQNIRVEQVRPHRSSSIANVCSSVIGAASGETAKHGRPPSIWTRSVLNPRRMRSATASPIDIPFAAATERTISVMSSGRFKVVRIKMSITSPHHLLVSGALDSKYGLLSPPSCFQVRRRNPTSAPPYPRANSPYPGTTHSVPRLNHAVPGNKMTVLGINIIFDMSLIFSSLRASAPFLTDLDRFLIFSHQQLVRVPTAPLF